MNVSGVEMTGAYELFEMVGKEHSDILKRCEYGLGNREYDDRKLLECTGVLRDLWKRV